MTILIGVLLFGIAFWAINELLKSLFPKTWSDTYDNSEYEDDNEDD